MVPEPDFEPLLNAIREKNQYITFGSIPVDTVFMFVDGPRMNRRDWRKTSNISAECIDGTLSGLDNNTLVQVLE